MNESAAREVVLVRAIEQADAERRVWNDEDRAWATRAAAEVVGAHSPEDAFLARRASLSIERLGARHPSVKRVLAATTWRPWIGWAVVMIAFAAGVATDQIGPAKRVNILAFPLIALLAWNLVVYAFIIVQALARLFGAAPTLGPLRGAIARLGRATAAPVNDRDPTLARGLATFAADWTQFSLPLASARVGRILHLGALAFALGAIAGMYVRGSRSSIAPVGKARSSTRNPSAGFSAPCWGRPRSSPVLRCPMRRGSRQFVSAPARARTLRLGCIFMP